MIILICPTCGSNNLKLLKNKYYCYWCMKYQNIPYYEKHQIETEAIMDAFIGLIPVLSVIGIATYMMDRGSK